MGTSVQATERYIEAAKHRSRYYRQFNRSPERQVFDKKTWQAFSDYLGSKDPWDATDEELAAWCANLAARGLAHATIQNSLASIGYTFGIAGKGSLHGRPGTGVRNDNPSDSEIVRSTLRGIKVIQKRRPSRKAPIHLSLLDKLIDLQTDTIVGIRNRAIYAMAWAGALNRSEIRNLDIRPDGDGTGHVEIADNGFTIRLHHHAGWRLGRLWSNVCVPERKDYPSHCPLFLLREWLRIYDVNDGPIFPSVLRGSIRYGERIGPGVAYMTLKRGVKKLGLAAQDYGLHSLRRGCIEWMAEERVPMDSIMRHARIRQTKQAVSYVRPYRTIEDSPLKLTRWSK